MQAALKERDMALKASSPEEIEKGLHDVKIGACLEADEPFRHDILPIRYGQNMEPRVAGEFPAGKNAEAQALGHGLIGRFPALDFDQPGGVHSAAADFGFEECSRHR